MWQEIIVGVCVLVALAFMIKRFLPRTQGARDAEAAVKPVNVAR